MIFFATYFLAGLILPSVLPGLLLLGTSVDLALPFGTFNIFSNEWALLGAFLGLGMRQFLRRDLPSMPKNLLLAFAPVAIVITAHTLYPGPRGATLKDLLRALEFFSGLLLPAWLLSDRSLRKTMQLAVCFTVLASFWGLIQHVAGPGAALNAGHELEITQGTFQEARSFFQHHNQFGAFESAATPFLAFFVSPWFCLVALLGLAVAYSRGAIVGVFFGAAVMSWALPRKQKFLLGCVLLAGITTPLLIPATRARVTSIASLQKNSDRLLIWGIGGQMWEKAPLWGNGGGYVHQNLPAKIDALDVNAADKMQYKAHLHNQWLQWAVEYGVVGSLAWMAFFLALFLGACQSARWGSGRARWCGIALGMMVVAFCLQQSTDLLMLHARGLDISLIWGLCFAGMRRGKRMGIEVDEGEDGRIRQRGTEEHVKGFF